MRGGPFLMARWTDYYNAVERQPPRPTLLGALKIWTRQPGTAVDLGCGTGRDTLELLQRGWKVHAIDAEAEAIRRLVSRVASNSQDRLTPVCARFEDVVLPSCDLINASFSLPFCRPDRMQDLWRSISSALCQEGLFAGQLFGERDGWAKQELSIMSRDQVEAHFADWRLLWLDEIEHDGTTAIGKPKHWHFFNVIAEKR